MRAHDWKTQMALISLTVVALFALAGLGTTSAHGKELTLEVSSFVPDSDQPLVKLFRVSVVYAGDLDPIKDADVRFSASRQGGGPAMDEAVLEPLNEPGVYVGEVEFPVFGVWEITIGVEGFGEGEVSFVEEVLPIVPSQDTSSEARQQVLSLFFRFDWKDVAAIFVRISHTVGGVIWFGMTGLLLASFWFLPQPARQALFQKMTTFFKPAAAFSLVLLALSGVYIGIYSAPINPPGIFDLDVMMAIPFGAHYMGTMVFKVVVLATYGVLTFRIAERLQLASMPAVAGGAVAASHELLSALRERPVADVEKSLYRLALANAVLGLLLAAAIVTAIYLHYISHLAVFVPS